MEISSAVVLTSADPGDQILLMIFPIVPPPPSFASCSSSICTGISANDGVGGGESVVHSSDHPPHGLGPATLPVRREMIMLPTRINVESPKMKDETVISTVSYTHLTLPTKRIV